MNLSAVMEAYIADPFKGREAFISAYECFCSAKEYDQIYPTPCDGRYYGPHEFAEDMRAIWGKNYTKHGVAPISGKVPYADIPTFDLSKGNPEEDAAYFHLLIQVMEKAYKMRDYYVVSVAMGWGFSYVPQAGKEDSDTYLHDCNIILAGNVGRGNRMIPMFEVKNIALAMPANDKEHWPFNPYLFLDLAWNCPDKLDSKLLGSLLRSLIVGPDHFGEQMHLLRVCLAYQKKFPDQLVGREDFFEEIVNTAFDCELRFEADLDSRIYRKDYNVKHLFILEGLKYHGFLVKKDKRELRNRFLDLRQKVLDFEDNVNPDGAYATRAYDRIAARL